MKSIRVRLKDNTDMGWTRKHFSYLCPFDTIEVGDYVLLDSKKGNRLSVGEVLEVAEENAYTAYALVICRLPIKDIDKRFKYVKKKRLEKLELLRYNSKDKIK